MTLDFTQIIASSFTGVAVALVTRWSNDKVTAWRLRSLESRMAKTEGNVSELQQRIAGLKARL